MAYALFGISDTILMCPADNLFESVPVSALPWWNIACHAEDLYMPEKNRWSHLIIDVSYYNYKQNF